VPLALQALLPLLVVVVAAVIVIARPRHELNGRVALGATSLAGIVTLVELLRLSPGERVDVPYLTSFPYADLAIRLDGLSLAFAVVTLLTAALLMLVRLNAPGDRRDPWASWLLTTAAVLAVTMAASLLLVYILLQVLTLAWSGTLDEAAPRRRGLRLAIGVADIGLLLVAASAVQSVGTSAFSGVPSDTFGPAAVLLALLPVMVRVLALHRAASGTEAPVAFEPAVAFAAPAGYLLLRLVAVMGGRLPGRPVEIVVFGGALLLAALGAITVLVERPAGRFPRLLLLSQAALALAFLASSLPLLALASTWLWLQLILLTGLCSVYRKGEQLAGEVVSLTLAALPGTTAFVALWIAGVGLRAGNDILPLLAVVVVALLMAAAAISRVRRIASGGIDVPAMWALAMLAIAAVPSLALGPLVLPAAQTVRNLPSGAVLLSPLGFILSGILWPAPAVAILLAGLLAGLWRTRATLPWRPLELASPPMPRFPGAISLRLPSRWATRAIWTALLAITAAAVLRP
jgi:hypothetical protein